MILICFLKNWNLNTSQVRGLVTLWRHVSTNVGERALLHRGMRCVERWQQKIKTTQRLIIMLISDKSGIVKSM